VEIFAHKIEHLLKEKLSFYYKLADILKQEKKFILNINVDSLWKVSSKKKNIVELIEKLRKKILYLFDEKKIDHEMNIKTFNLSELIALVPLHGGKKTNLRYLKIKLDGIKQEITLLAKENKNFINEYFCIVDDLVTTIINEADKDSCKSVYGNFCSNKINKPRQNFLFKAKV